MVILQSKSTMFGKKTKTSYFPPPSFPGMEPTYHARATFAERIAHPIVQLITTTAGTTHSTHSSSRKRSARKHPSTRKSSRQGSQSMTTTMPLRLWYVEPKSSTRVASVRFVGRRTRPRGHCVSTHCCCDDCPFSQGDCSTPPWSCGRAWRCTNTVSVANNHHTKVIG
jgi:hypothetical protein